MNDPQQGRIIEILVETDTTHVHVDRTDDVCVVSYDEDIPPNEVVDLIKAAVDSGYTWIHEQWHDADLDRHVAVFKRTRSGYED